MNTSILIEPIVDGNIKYSSYTPAQKKANQKYREQNRDKVNEQRKQYYQKKKEEDPEFLEKKREKAREYYKKKTEFLTNVVIGTPEEKKTLGDMIDKMVEPVIEPSKLEPLPPPPEILEKPKLKRQTNKPPGKFIKQTSCPEFIPEPIVNNFIEIPEVKNDDWGESKDLPIIMPEAKLQTPVCNPPKTPRSQKKGKR